MPEIAKDALLDEDRDVIIENGDILLSEDDETIEQSIGILVGEETGPRIGGPLSAQSLASIRIAIQNALENEEMLSSVQSISIEEATTDGTITLVARTRFNNEFTFTV